jgi:hypothetical protein
MGKNLYRILCYNMFNINKTYVTKNFKSCSQMIKFISFNVKTSCKIFHFDYKFYGSYQFYSKMQEMKLICGKFRSSEVFYLICNVMLSTLIR